MKTKRRWSDMTTRQKTVTVVAGAVQLALAATAWMDLRRRPAKLVNGSKVMWAGIIGVNFVGPIAYFVWGRRRHG